MRPKGVCNCPLKVNEGGRVVCKLDGKKCKVYLTGASLQCRGWLPDGKPSELQKQKSLFECKI